MRTSRFSGCRTLFILAVLAISFGAFANAYAQESEKSDYRIVGASPETQALYQADNPAHNVRSYFRSTGASVQPLVPIATWELGLDLYYGPASLAPAGTRLDYAHPGLPISSWFVNSEAGLTQTFSVGGPLKGAPPQKFIIDVAVSGGLIPVANAEANGVDFKTANGAVVLRGVLAPSTDGSGQAIASHLEASGPDGIVRIVLEPGDAAYPLTAAWSIVSAEVAASAPPSTPAPQAVITICNPALIEIPASGTTSGIARKYPSNIAVSGVGLISNVTVNLLGLSHTWPSDMDMLLVGPGGQKFVMLSDVWSSTDAVSINVTLDDTGPAIPTTGTPASGTYRPTDIGATDTFLAPAPAGPYNRPPTAGTSSFAATFAGTNADGTWSLYIVDDTGGDTGSMSGGWCLNLTQGCVNDANCDDSDPCTDEVCNSGVCVYSPHCVDGNLCTTDVCTGGVCTYPDVVCDDGNFCTDNNCIPATGCSYPNNTLPCDDGNICTGDDVCGGGICAGPTPLCPTDQFCNSGSITIPSSGAGTPYPSNIAVTAGLVNKVTVDLLGYNHTFPSDVDVLLVGPGGQNAIIMSDVGSSFDVVGVNLRLDDAAAASLPTSTQIVSGTFKPTNSGTGDTFPAPAPAPAGGSALSVFGGTPSTGTWSLYVVDDAGGDLGSFAGGWCVNVTHACQSDADCNDGNVCTDDSCANFYCIHSPNTSPCDDGNLCTSEDTCGDGSCQPGWPNTLPCDDGNLCTVRDTCAGGACVGETDNCDNDRCTTDTCEPPANCAPFNENFDGVTAPALPAGWTTTGTGNLWRTVTTSFDTPPNAAFTDDPSTVTDKYLDSPAISIADPAAVLTFRIRYATESIFDGAVLEISFDGGATFQDIVAAGGVFVTGDYNSTISVNFGSPIAGRRAWSGTSTGFVLSTVNLPAAAAGQSIVLRWRMASDTSLSSTGVWVDTVAINQPCYVRVCVPDGPTDCEDGDPCTADWCDPWLGCQHEASTDYDLDGVCYPPDNCPYTYNPDQLDSDGDGQGDVCDPCPFDPLDDADHDGVCGDVDQCANSNLSLTVSVAGCDSGVYNTLFPTGCTVQDLVNNCGVGAANHGVFVSCVAHLTNDLKDQGVMTGRQKGRIQRCAAQSNPHPAPSVIRTVGERRG